MSNNTIDNDYEITKLTINATDKFIMTKFPAFHSTHSLNKETNEIESIMEHYVSLFYSIV